MCVTSSPAAIDMTSVFTLVTQEQEGGVVRHVTGYQNRAKDLSGKPNCMFLHIPCTDDIKLVDGPQQTTNLMQAITRDLPEVETHPVTRGLISATHPGPPVFKYGDYDVVLASNPDDILGAIERVTEDRRPTVDDNFVRMAGWYRDNFSDHSFILACFNGLVNPRHPIVVSYIPHNDDVVFAPGLDAHDGYLPVIGSKMPRDFAVAFAVAGVELPINVHHHGAANATGAWWAPETVTGFYDNRREGTNSDYVIAIEDLAVGSPGHELLELCY